MTHRDTSGTSRPSTTTRRTLAGLAASVLIAGGLGIAAAVPAGAAGKTLHDDFNHDGYADLVVAAPSATVSGHRAAGYVAVLWGAASGLSTSHRTVISQGTSGVPGAPETGDAFGAAVASGDFDGDGFADLAVGSPGEDLGTATDSGGGVVLFGSASGLPCDDSVGIQAGDDPAPQQEFGKGLATGHFIEGGGTSLVVLADSQLWEFDGAEPVSGNTAKLQRVPGAEKPLRQEDGVIATGLTAGNFNGDGFTDLAVNGVRTGSQDGQGVTDWFSGSTGGLQLQTEFAGGPAGAAGDLNGDGFDDLVTGEPSPPDAAATGGRVEVWYGSANGPAATPQVWTQDSDGVAGVDETGDEWGGDVSVGDVNGDGLADLAIGGAGEAIGTVSDAGAVWLLRGAAGGVTAARSQTFNQDTANVPGVPEKLDRFGDQVRLIDANGDGKAGLIASAPGENTFDGFCWVFNASSAGLSPGSLSFGGATVGANGADAQFGSTIGE